MVSHAFCNVDDVSWGTKGSSGSGVNKYQTDKVYFVSTWLFINSILTFIFLYVDVISKTITPDGYKRPDYILIIIAVYGTATMTVKTVLATMHQIKWLFCERCCNTNLLRKDEQPRVDIIDKYWDENFLRWMKR